MLKGLKLGALAPVAPWMAGAGVISGLLGVASRLLPLEKATWLWRWFPGLTLLCVVLEFSKAGKVKGIGRALWLVGAGGFVLQAIKSFQSGGVNFGEAVDIPGLPKQ